MPASIADQGNWELKSDGSWEFRDKGDRVIAKTKYHAASGTYRWYQVRSGAPDVRCKRSYANHREAKISATGWIIQCAKNLPAQA